MGVLKFTVGDKLAAVVIDKGWYPCIVKEIGSGAASKSGKSITYNVTFQLAEGPRKGKEHEVAFNTETSSISLLGNRQFFPDNQFLVLQAAVKGIKLDDVDLQMDTDDLLNKPLDIQFDVAMADGTPVNIATGFAPAGKGTSGVPWA